MLKINSKPRKIQIQGVPQKWAVLSLYFSLKLHPFMQNNVYCIQ